MTHQRYACSKGHDKVLWSMGGGYVERDKRGRAIRVNDHRCWYCGKQLESLAPWPTT